MTFESFFNSTPLPSKSKNARGKSATSKTFFNKTSGISNVPDLTGLTRINAINELIAAGIDYSINYITAGATSQNNDTVVSQSDSDDIVIVNVYQYVIPGSAMPNLVGLTEAAATIVLTNAGFVKGTVTTANNASGATEINDQFVKTQAIAAGTITVAGTSVAIVKYQYVLEGPASYSILAIQYNMGMNNAYDMYLPDRVNKPSVGDKVFVFNNARATFNRKWTVAAVVNDDVYSAGGTKVSFSDNGGGGDINYNLGGRWFVIPTSLPFRLPLVQRTENAYPEPPWAHLDNNGEGGRIRVRIPTYSTMYALVTSTGISGANNAYAGKTITFSNIMSNPSTGTNETYSYLNGTKTVYASSIFEMSGQATGLDITLEDTTVVTSGTEYEYNREIYGMAVVNA
jgi:hypothetical protein